MQWPIKFEEIYIKENIHHIQKSQGKEKKNEIINRASVYFSFLKQEKTERKPLYSSKEN